MGDGNTIFEEALAELLNIEGGFSDVEQDRGSETNWGVTEALAHDYGYDGDMRDLPLDTAKHIYREAFWDHRRLRLGEMAEVSAPAAGEVFEQAVNTGVFPTARRAQRVLNILNRDEDLYPDLKVDGWLGRVTRDAVATLVAAGDGGYLLQWFNVAQGRHYFDLCERDPTQEAFARGWVAKRVSV